jgi:hypothetical protein
MFPRSFQGAEEDCARAIAIDPSYVKSYARRATARRSLGRLREAAEGTALIRCICGCVVERDPDILNLMQTWSKRSNWNLEIRNLLNSCAQFEPNWDNQWCSLSLSLSLS